MMCNIVLTKVGGLSIDGRRQIRPYLTTSCWVGFQSKHCICHNEVVLITFDKNLFI